MRRGRARNALIMGFYKRPGQTCVDVMSIISQEPTRCSILAMEGEPNIMVRNGWMALLTSSEASVTKALQNAPAPAS